MPAPTTTTSYTDVSLPAGAVLPRARAPSAKGGPRRPPCSLRERGECSRSGGPIARTLWCRARSGRSSAMTEPGALWRWHDRVRRQDEQRHETMKAIRRDDPAWALRHIAGPDAALDYLQA